MHKILRTYFIISILIYGLHASAQYYKPEDLKLWQIKGFAESAKKQRDYYSAINYNKYLLKKKPKSKKYLWELSMLYYKYRDYNKASESFEKYLTKNKKRPELTTYYLAKSKKSLGQYSKALELFKSIKVKKQQPWMPKNFKAKLKEHVLGCNIALAKDLDDSKIDVVRLDSSINHAHAEACPLYLTDSLMAYSSTEMDSVNFYSVNDREIPEQRFNVALRSDRNWEEIPEIPKKFQNLKFSDAGDVAYSYDKERFYFTKASKNWQNRIVQHLYVSNLKNGEWQEPQYLGNNINLSDFYSMQPSVGVCFDPNLEVIYFISNRTGGYGGADIWYTVYDRIKKTYQPPVNVGIVINTEGNEVTPFYDNDSHRLYYSSNTKVGFGGLDVFYSIGELVNWDEPENIGTPINSSYDDLYYTENKLGNMGFITSNRKGSMALTHENCCDDIFEWKKTEVEKVLVSGNILGNDTELSSIFDQTKGKNNTKSNVIGIDSAKINIYQKIDSMRLVFIGSENTDDKGSFKMLVPKGFDYELIVDDGRVLERKVSFDTKHIAKKKQVYELEPVKLKVATNRSHILENINFEFNSYTLTSKSKQIIDNTVYKLLEQFQDILIEIRSHTDNVGNDKYNMKLSKKRSDAVVEYLVSKGIAEYRLKAVGFGESMPIALNKFADGRDNPEGRLKNRRTEFRVVDSREIR